MRTRLLATTAGAAVLLAATSAHAIDGIWQGPGTSGPMFHLRKGHLKHAVLAAITFLGLASWVTCTSLHAQTWTGTSSSDWFTSANWTNPQQVPQGTLPVFLTGANPTAINGGTAVSGLLEVGSNPGDVASLTIQNGGILNTGGNGSDIANASGSTGTVIVTAGSSWNLAGLLSVGTGGTGTLIISNGGKVSDGGNGSFIGFETGSVGTVTVIGPGSVWDTSAALRVGGDRRRRRCPSRGRHRHPDYSRWWRGERDWWDRDPLRCAAGGFKWNREYRCTAP